MFWKNICYPAIKVPPNTSIANCICSASTGVRISERYATAFLVSQEKIWLKYGLKKKQKTGRTAYLHGKTNLRSKSTQNPGFLPKATLERSVFGRQEEASAEWLSVWRACKQTVGIIPAFFPHVSWTSPSLDRGKGTGKLQCCELFYSRPMQVLSLDRLFWIF